MTASPDFAEFLCDQLAPLGRITMRRMFGKTGVFCGGVMLGMVTDNTLYLRVDAQNDRRLRLQNPDDGIVEVAIRANEVMWPAIDPRRLVRDPADSVTENLGMKRA